MRITEDISILLTDKDFQKILSEWIGFNDAKKEEVCGKYDLTVKDLEILRQLWMGLDFKRFQYSDVEDSLNETVWKMAERKISTAKRNAAREFNETFMRVAAILIIPLIVYTAYIQFFKSDAVLTDEQGQFVTVSSQPGTMTKLILPDGSQVWLNSASSISYPRSFSRSIREVALTGEAYFEVTKEKHVPMVVSAGDARVKVYGTSFNVNAFPSEKSVKVTLVEGSVSFSSLSHKVNDQDEFFVEPGQTVAFDKKSKKMVVQHDDPFLHIAWKDGLLVFRNSTFETVLEHLSRKFNVDIELKDPELAPIPMDATFRDENVSEILRLLSLSTPFRYYYDSAGKTPDGTFAKSKIYIERK
jgi:transmembrane sensor